MHATATSMAVSICSEVHEYVSCILFKEYAHALSELQLTRSLRLTLHLNYIFQLCSTWIVVVLS